MFIIKPNIEKLERKRNLKKLIKVIGHYEDNSIRCQAIIALGRIGDPLAVEPLIDILKDTDKQIRVEASKSINKIGAPSYVKPKINTILATQSYDINVRKSAIKNIEDTLSKEDAVEFSKSPYSDIRIFAIKQTSLPRQYIFKLGLCNDPNKEVACTAFRRISKKATPKEITLLQFNATIWEQIACHENAPTALTAKLLDKYINRSKRVVDIPAKGHYEPADEQTRIAYDVAYSAEAPDEYVEDSPAQSHYEYDSNDIAEANRIIDAAPRGRKEILKCLQNIQSELYAYLK